MRQQITPEVEREKIVDLGIADDEGSDPARGSALRLTWTQLSQSSVTVYRTQRPVDPAASDRATVPEEALANAGLPQDAAITAAAGIEQLDTLARQLRTISAVPWPDGHEWDTIYFTPVTFHGDGEVTIGTTVQRKRATSIENVTLTRRLNWDLVTFTWPGDATLVELRMTALDAPFDASAAPFMSVTHEDYQADGGCVIKNGLPAPGGRLHLNAITYMSGTQISSPPVSIEVPSLWTYQYSLKWPGDVKVMGGFMRQAVARFGHTVVEITVEALRGSRISREPSDWPCFTTLRTFLSTPLTGRESTCSWSAPPRTTTHRLKRPSRCRLTASRCHYGSITRNSLPDTSGWLSTPIH